MDNLKIVIAGPGAGKTYNLKTEVLTSLNTLKCNKYCAVITYTNAATEELRNRISKDVQIPPNVFIGTIHSFLIRFILEPYGHLLKIVPKEKNYIEDVTLNYKAKNIFAENNAKQSRASILAEKGFLAYDKVIEFSKVILDNNPNIVNHLSNRLQYIFIDEYQDSRIYIHQIFHKILNIKTSKITIIGDPLQAIFKFTYLNTLNRDEFKSQPKSFAETPMMLLKSSFRLGNDIVLKENHRSSSSIVKLVNNYITEKEYKQISINGDNQIPVYFIDKEEVINILNIYNQIKKNHEIEKIQLNNLKKDKNLLKEFYLTTNWIDKASKRKPKFDLLYSEIKNEAARLEKGNYKLTSILNEISRCILAIAGCKKIDFIRNYQDEISFRKFCFDIIRKIDTIKNRNQVSNFIREEFKRKYKLSYDFGKQINVENSLFELSNKKSMSLIKSPESCYSTIHSSKGLEATSVLAIAYSANELMKWLNFNSASNDLDDDFRLGYVAFSRARDLLCISCLEKVSEPIKEKLRDLDIQILPGTNKAKPLF